MITELWASGIPVIGFDYGAVGERIRESGAGWVAPEPTAAAVLAIIEQLRKEPGEHVRKVAAVRVWQNEVGRLNDCQHMSTRYFEIYRSLIPSITQESQKSALL
jgi:glycosyltransferase involved in cell wall biosynthesis